MVANVSYITISFREALSEQVFVLEILSQQYWDNISNTVLNVQQIRKSVAYLIGHSACMDWIPIIHFSPGKQFVACQERSKCFSNNINVTPTKCDHLDHPNHQALPIISLRYDIKSNGKIFSNTVGSIPRPVCMKCPLDLIMISCSSPSDFFGMMRWSLLWLGLIFLRPFNRVSSTQKSIQIEGTLFEHETPLWY